MTRLAALLAWAATQPAAAGGVELLTPMLDFREAVRGAAVENQAAVVNGSGHPVEIHVAALGCGCLWSESLKLAPGAAGFLFIRLDTAKTPPGFVQRFASFRVEPGGELLQVELRGKVHSPFRAAPPVIGLAPAAGLVVVELHGALPFEVENLAAPAQGWSWAARKLRHGEGHEITLQRSDGPKETPPSVFVFELKHRLGKARVVVPAFASLPD